MSRTSNLQVNLLFQANTTAAMTNIKSLSSLLHQIGTNTRIGVDSGSIQQAVIAAQQLQVHLNEAVNVDTGKLNLTKLNSSLAASGQSLQGLASQLQGAGETGQQAFLKLSNAVAHAEAPVRQTSAALQNLGVTLMNTIKWQATSMLVHGAISSFNKAVTHAQNLNNALNDIRIVTGYGTDSMAQFAAEASKAASSLNTTTTEYAKAALIFYQQGLNGDAVTERADTVIKLAHVTGQSAETVSDQMTAIWNNFDDGSKSLEYYADVLTKLGATTAASTDEISDGLEKFAAVADTVGLSYEYAAASVATVVAETRQSADVVGTAFKTIFARMEGLKLGETLEDGVDLNKYSQALASVGVQVLDASGQLRDMDDILNDLGDKWQYFGEETKVALAQTVGGVRQYNQMLSMMENWDKIIDNVEVAKKSTGELQKQQYIWSQSAEAAAERVKQAQNELYESLINDKLVIGVQDVFAQLVSGVGDAVEAMGGIGPMILMIAGLFSNRLMPIIQKGLAGMVNNFRVAFGFATNDAIRMQEVMKIGMMDMMEKYNITGPMQQQILLSKDLITAKQKLAEASKNMSAVELEEAQRRMQVYEAMVTEAQASLELQAELEKEIALNQKRLLSGDNRKVLAEASAKQAFKSKHAANGEQVDDDYVDEIAEDARTFSSKEITASHKKTMSAFETKREDILTDPALNAEQQKAALADLEKAEKAQMQRYKDIIELQKQIGIEARKSADELKKASVGTVDGFQMDSDITKSGLDYSAGSESVKSYAATGQEMLQTSSTWDLSSNADGIDASVYNLEKLLQKMNEYSNQAQTLSTMAKDLGGSFDEQGIHIQKAVGAMGEYSIAADGTVQVVGGYEGALVEVQQKEAEREAALRKLIEAEKAAAEAGKKDKDAAAAVKKAKAELKTAEENLTKAQVKAKTQFTSLSKESQKYVKQLGSVKKALLEAAKSSSNSANEMARINAIFDRLGKGGKESENAMVELQQEMIRLGKGSESAANGIEDLATSIKNKLIDSNMSADEINAFINNMEKMGLISPEVANKLRMVGNAGDELGVKVSSGADRAAAAIGFMATAASQISMGISAVQTFMNAWRDGNTPLETAIGLLSSMAMLFPVVASGIKAVTAIKKASMIVEAASNAAKQAGTKLTWKHIAAQNAEKVSEMALIVVKTIRAAVEKLGVAGVVVGIALAAAAIAGTIALTASLKDNTKAKLDNAKAASEASSNLAESINKTQELANEVANLTEEYEKLAKAGKNTSEVLDNMNDKIPELIQSYRDLADSMSSKDELALNEMTDELEHLYNVAKLTGDYTEFNKKKAEIDKSITLTEYSNAISGGQSTGLLGANAMSEATKGSVSGNKLKLKLDGSDATWRVFGGGTDKRLENEKYEESKAQQILKNKMGDYYTGGHNSSWFTRTTANLEVDYTNPAEFVEYYESLQEAQREMASTMTEDQLADSDIYRELQDAISAGAESYEKMLPLAQAQADAGGKLAEEWLKNGGTTKETGTVISGMSAEDVDNMAEYITYRQQFIKVAKEQYGLTESQAEMYLRESEALDSVTTEYELATAMLKNFAGMTEEDIKTLQSSPEQFLAYSEGMKNILTDTFGELSDEELKIAVSIAATADSIEEFGEQMQRALITSARQGFEASASVAGEAMASAVEKGQFDFSGLLNDDNFIAYLEERGIQQVELTAASYEEQYRIVSEFYSKVSGEAFKTYKQEENLLALQLATRQREMAAYHEAMKNSGADVKAAQEAYAQKQKELAEATSAEMRIKIQQELDKMEFDFKEEYDFDITSNAQTIQNEIDALINSLEELQNKQIEIAMDWSGVDKVESGMKKAAEFAKVIDKDTKKVGNSYVMTAAQAREWLEFYPELGYIAEKTNDGLIAMDAAKVEEFMANNDKELDNSIDTQIKELQSQKATLEAELEAKMLEREAAEKLKKGELDLENVSAEYLVNLRKNLVDYYINAGYDEQQAQVLALKTMKMNEETYAERVAELADQQAVDMGEAAEAGANAQVDSLKQLGQRWSSFASFLLNNIGTVLYDIGCALLDPTRTVSSVFKGYWDNTAISVSANTGGGNYDYSTDDNFELSEFDISAAYESVGDLQYDFVDSEITELFNAIGALDGKIDYLEALKDQDLSDYGSTDPDEVDGTNDEKNNKKDVEDMIDNAERYHEITKEIEAMERAFDRLSEKKDRAFGRDKLAYMEEEIALSEKLLEKEAALLDAQTIFLATDLAAIEKEFTTAVELDEYDNLANYSALLEEAQTAYNNAKKAYNESEQGDADKDLLEQAEKDYERKMELLKQYEETLEAQQEQADKVLEQARKLQDLNYEKINYELEFKLDINSKDLEQIDYYLNKISDDAFSFAEAYGYLSSQTTLYTDNLKAQESYMAKIEEEYRAGKISQEAYYEALAESQSATIDNLESLEATKKAMREYYGNTMDAAMEKIATYTNQMEHLNSVLDHYSNILSLAGKDSDTVAKGKILDSKANNLRNEMLTQQALYENSAAEAEKWKAKMDAAVEGSNEWETYKANWEKAQEAANNAQESMLAKTEEWANATKAIVENELAGLAQTLEKSLTGGTSFDEMITSMDRAQSLQEDYLTTTNQIYETNKLMRQAQQEIDKSTNSAAKKRLQSFINETEEMQNQNKLSQYELNIQQAKYDLLLAEIALEEAKDAKSTVRLQRDSEGNFGYVYTADSSAVSAAEQELADKQNALYNLGLDGANDYNQKYAQTLQESQEAITELTAMWMNGEISSEEEFQRRRDELQRYYTQKLEGYSHQYQVALTTDSRIIKDAWSSDFSDMMYQTEEWGNAVNTYFGDASGSFAKWTEAQAVLLSETGLNNVDSAVAAINEESEKLATTLLGEDGDGGVVGAMKEEIEAVGDLSEQYVTLQDEIDKTIAKYETFLNTVNQSYTGQESVVSDPTPSSTTSSTTTTTDSGSTTPQASTTTTTTGSSSDSATQSGETNKQQSSAVEEQQAKEIQLLQDELTALRAEYEQVLSGKSKSGSVDDYLSGKISDQMYKDEAQLIELKYAAMLQEQEQAYSMMLQAKMYAINGAGGGPYQKMIIQEQQALEKMYASQMLTTGKIGGQGFGGVSIEADEIRNILDIIDLESQKAQLHGLLATPLMPDHSIDKLEQEVYIEAHFPDVQDRNEIEEAFNNLINKASQYANRR